MCDMGWVNVVDARVKVVEKVSWQMIWWCSLWWMRWWRWLRKI